MTTQRRPTPNARLPQRRRTPQPRPPVAGRRPGGSPTRRPTRGPCRAWTPCAKVLGAARYTDDLVVPGAWHGCTVRATEPHARLLGIERDPAFDWSRVVVLTAADVPGENVIHLMKDDQPVLAADEIRHVGEPVALVAAPDPRAWPAPRATTSGSARSRSRPVTDMLARTTSSPSTTIDRGDLEAGFAAGGPGRRGDVPRRPPGAALHRDPGHDRRPAAGRRRDRARLAAVPLLRARRAEAGARPRRRALRRGPGGDRRRVRRQGGVPVRARHPRRDAGAGGRAPGPADLRPPRGHLRHHQAPSGGGPIPHRGHARRPPGRPGHRHHVRRAAPTRRSRRWCSRAARCTRAGPYACPNVRIRSRAVRTNTPPTGAFRGFGAPQTEFAAEMQVNRSPRRSGVSPVGAAGALGVPSSATRRPTSQVLRDSVSAPGDARPRRSRSADFEARRTGLRGGPHASTRRGRTRTAPRHRAGAGLARGRLHRRRREVPRQRRRAWS